MFHKKQIYGIICAQRQTYSFHPYNDLHKHSSPCFNNSSVRYRLEVTQIPNSYARSKFINGAQNSLKDHDSRAKSNETATKYRRKREGAPFPWRVSGISSGVLFAVKIKHHRVAEVRGS